ncbi:Gfo/Idh/MocA family protein [Dickeya poaceiphila]|uniref:Gfo/Idh/MocA family oxidoreductase n=1 Tax=Dickeya poaceiphila TaxID=568768 RepID=A0A5B8I746_9GAMM|nr:Gfo/Idh/MocA family oxidoreductase [Dickeya poaceiphila]QDX30203.1 Gfo/Idh/MocA family oxidoreductase [Dickeya poaceiphila]
MKLVRIGVVGLGDIARKAYLPILSQAEYWQLAGAWSPGQERARQLCQQYRMTCFSSLEMLISQCDAVFVHSSTASHYEVVKTLLLAGKHVYVDKPLAETLTQAEELVALAARHDLLLMVGFNRRFAPLYQRLRQVQPSADSLRMEKHRVDNIGPQPLAFTLLDDYLHVVDTALWLAQTPDLPTALCGGRIRCNLQGQLVYAEHQFRTSHGVITTSMHRQAGSQRESVQLVNDGGWYQVDNLREWREERNGMVLLHPTPSWQSTLEQRGFVGAVRHFIDAVVSHSPPLTSGDQALYAQRLIEMLLREC